MVSTRSRLLTLGFGTLGAAVAAFVGTQVMGQPLATGETRQPQAQAGSAAPSSEVERGRYLAALGDCMPCHTRKGGQPFAGGRPLETPFGTVLSANITADRETGIGSWTADQFYRALHEGIDNGGNHLFPAFPYNYYTRVSRQDSDAIFAYLRTTAPVRNNPDRNQLAFPFNIRFLMTGWNWLFLDAGEFKPDPSKSAAWNRGAYLVEGLGHCGACHTPKNLMGAPEHSNHLQGGTFGEWFAPDLTTNKRTGLGGWSHRELVEFLKTGRNAHAAASGEMGEVVAFSTSLASESDLEAIATYIGDQNGEPQAEPDKPKQQQLAQGEAIYVDSCSACHQMRGEGIPGFFPPLRGNANLQQSDPTTTLHFILTGVQSTPTNARPTGLSMPAYAWKLTDDQIAAVESYIRNSWGNRASPVSADDVAKLRKQIVNPLSQRQAKETAGTLAHPGPLTLAPPGTDSRDNGTPHAGRPAQGGAEGDHGPDSGGGGGRTTGPAAGGPG